ncbi:dihydrolipoyl dehydrogenase [Bacillus sp. V3-13]|uniref:dihydrolipoyl dehydrogenase n=1 Tax=Bacillus sp. V3-13 TaxID=2053728 RepID=UPI000C75E1D2|nr:dihydrolipoyl dehydrogenase [Bacillus sp. V3-13]PLR78764.1 dihydrolipoyl dehydrogenase [Bacillus sp. V3-13]
MKKEIIVPKAGLTMTEATIATWAVSEGEHVKKDQVIADIMTEKITVEVVSPDDGRIESILKKEGETVQVGESLATLVTNANSGGEKPEHPQPAIQGNEKTNAGQNETAYQSFDVVVIGGGPGGYVAAIRAAQLGGKVALIEQKELGGVCLNSGCIPTKTLLKGSELTKLHKKAADFGVFFSTPSIDFPKLIEKKDAIVSQLQTGVLQLLQKNKVQIINATGTVVSPQKVDVQKRNGESELLHAKHIILATGSKPVLPSIPGLNESRPMTSEEALFHTKLPASIAIIGAGAIGCEFAGIYAPLGVKVTLIESANEILPGIDEDIANFLKRSLIKDEVNIITSARIKEVSNDGKQKTLYIEHSNDYHKVQVEQILVAAGRMPNLDVIKSIGLKTENGRVWVDENLKTSVSSIFAVGDLTGIENLAHVASAQGIIAAENCLGQNRKMDYQFVPKCIYTSPEIASVGLTEAEATQKGLKYQVGKYYFNHNGRALTNGESEGFIKVLREEKYNQILGVHIIGYHASELIAEATLALNLESTTEELGSTIHPHPTLSEGLMEAALSSMNIAIHS